MIILRRFSYSFATKLRVYMETYYTPQLWFLQIEVKRHFKDVQIEVAEQYEKGDRKFDIQVVKDNQEPVLIFSTDLEGQVDLFNIDDILHRIKKYQ